MLAVVDILPPPTPNSYRAAPEILATCRVDGCPECVVNTEAPFDAYPTRGGYVATYRCSDCGHHWSTAWSER